MKPKRQFGEQRKKFFKLRKSQVTDILWIMLQFELDTEHGLLLLWVQIVQNRFVVAVMPSILPWVGCLGFKLAAHPHA